MSLTFPDVETVVYPELRGSSNWRGSESLTLLLAILIEPPSSMPNLPTWYINFNETREPAETSSAGSISAHPSHDLSMISTDETGILDF